MFSGVEYNIVVRYSLRFITEDFWTVIMICNKNGGKKKNLDQTEVIMMDKHLLTS